jgi:Dolichyl-phosphate-mannose-protein mannosyltransferase
VNPLAEFSTRLPRSAASRLRRPLAAASVLTMLVAAVGLIGAALRLREYVADRSLWLDESFLALNLIRHDVPALLGRLDFNQGAAPGFLLVEKGIEVIDRSEAALRLPSLVFGLATVALAWQVARRVCSPAGALLAYALVALSPALVYYSSELKQYAGDTVCGLAVTLVALELAAHPSRRTAVAAAAVGAAAVSLSHAAIFVVAGQGGLLVAAALVRKRLRSRLLAIVVGVWAVAAGAGLAHTLSTASGILSSYRASADLGSGTAGSGGRGAHALKALATALLGDVGLPTGGHAFTLVTLVLSAFGLLGLVALLRARPLATLVVGMPGLVTLAANATDHYPVSGRTVLFLVPIASICIGEGAASLARVAHGAAPVVGVGLAVLALAYPVHGDLDLLRTPTKEETRPVVSALALEARPGDRFFVTYAAQYAIAYYQQCGCTRVPGWNLMPSPGGRAQWSPALLSTQEVLIQPYRDGDENAYLAEVRTLPPGRTWLIVSHAADAGEHAFLYDRLQRAFAARGTRLTRIREPGALATLYALR